jgi:hypothetical protein
LCVGVDDLGNVVASGRPTGGAAAWTVTTVDTNGEGLNGVSCVSVLCVAVDEAGDVVTSTDPTDGPWTVANVDGLSGLSDVSCASKSFCAAGDEIGDVVTSTDPTGGADAWTAPTSVDPGTNGGINGVSCVSSSFCVAVDGAGDVVSSTDPTGGPAAWTVTNVDGTSGLTPGTLSPRPTRRWSTRSGALPRTLTRPPMAACPPCPVQRRRSASRSMRRATL